MQEGAPEPDYLRTAHRSHRPLSDGEFYWCSGEILLLKAPTGTVRILTPDYTCGSGQAREGPQNSPNLLN
ncbi:hypothetical protein D3C79_864010 [compost metagenome]